MPNITINRAVCLVLDKRMDNWKRIRDDWQDVNIIVWPFFAGNGTTSTRCLYDHIDEIPPERPANSYPAFRNRPNSYNAFLCFRKIIQKAKDDGIDNLLILEDDAVIQPNFGEIFDKAVSQLNGRPFKMLYLGANHAFAPTKEVGPNLLELNGSGCFHAVILNKSVFDEILALPLVNPIDGIVAKEIHPKGGCYAVWPNIVLTKSGYSECEGREVNYDEFWSKRGC